MTQQELEGNKLIAEFMGGTLVGCANSEYKEVYQFETDITYFAGKKWPAPVLAYHSSWDWLMPVVEMIKNIVCNSEFIYRIGNDLLTIDIDKVFKRVVEFIKWYNQNK
jgi:hypothetical protein